LNAANPLGVLRGLQTFLQLVDVSPDGFAAPAVSIKDQPRFGWRGLLIDSSRHFTPIEVLKRNLDGMEAVKMNVFIGTSRTIRDFAPRARNCRSCMAWDRRAYYTQTKFASDCVRARPRDPRRCGI